MIADYLYGASRLEAEIEEWLRPDRERFVAYRSTILHRDLHEFLNLRRPDRTADEVGWAPPILWTATDYPLAESNFRRRYTGLTVPPKRQPWVVRIRPDADEQVERRAYEDTRDLTRLFVERAVAKLAPIIETRPDYVLAPSENDPSRSFREDRWSGLLRLIFRADGAEVSLAAGVILNWTRSGQPFHQYRLTFHEFRPGPGGGEGRRTIGLRDLIDHFRRNGDKDPERVTLAEAPDGEPT